MVGLCTDTSVILHRSRLPTSQSVNFLHPWICSSFTLGRGHFEMIKFGTFNKQIEM